MANTFNTLKNAPGQIAKLAAAMLEDKVQFCKSIDKEPESSFSMKSNYDTGDTIQISKPARFIPSSTADITSSIQDITEEKVALALNLRQVVPIALTSAEIATDMELKSWTSRVLDPAVSAIAQYIENSFLQTASQSTYNLVGTAGSTVFDTDTMLSANQKITEMGCPDFDNRFALMSPAANRSAVNARKGLFQSSSEVADQYKSGYMGTADGLNYISNNMLYRHANGTATGSITVTTTSTTGATTLALTGTGAQVLKKGTVFTIAAVNAVHPITKADLGYLQQFVVTADNTASSGSYTGVAISPTIYGSGSTSLQNVSALPQSGAVVTLVGNASTTYTQNIAYHKSAFRMASVPLFLPEGTHEAGQATSGGFTIRVIKDYTILTDRLIMRLDFLGGIAPVRPEWACRVTS